MHHPSASLPSNMVDPGHLDKIDKLFACGVGDHIHLPQLVVVGDQSSGKSSVLEGITKLPFPRDSGLCTRFATQITFRRAQAISTTITIIPHKGATPAYAEKLCAFKVLTHAVLEPVSFSKTMKDVHKLLGLSDNPSDGDNKSTFSEDVLKIEVTGPEQEHFSVVDVPGIFRTATKGMTTLADASMIKAMVPRYMINPRSVMLVVIPANVDIATQEIITLAEEADLDGHRTSPDLVDPGAEVGVMQLIKGDRHPLQLGWCLVRNLGQQQSQDNAADRSAVENAFFRDCSPWNELDKERVGVDALRSRLQEVLTSNIRREFSNVKREVLMKLNSAKRALKELGEKRQTPDEQRRFTMDISSRFREMVSLALNSNYSGHKWFDECSTLMYVTGVVNCGEAFADAVDKHGHAYGFKFDYTPEVPGRSNLSSNGGQGLKLRSTPDHPDLEDLISGERLIDDKISTNIIEWLSGLYKSSRGFELGTFDKNLLGTTMKAQSAKWEPLAHGYILDIIHLAHVFITDLLKLVCPSARVRNGIMSVMMEPLMEIYRRALEQVQFVLYVEHNNPQTINHYFNDNLEKSRQKRLRASLEKHATTQPTQFGTTGRSVIALDDIVQNHPMSNAQHTVYEVHDILKAYYKVARKRFVDNVCMQAADYLLVTGPKNPLKLFSPQFVSSLNDDQLEEIAGEDAGTKRRRNAWAKEVKDMELGKKILVGVA
ncbi:dynamin GTPase [Aureobasidium subglaciale]|nr:dynamin GTPase [Aureobasidium subglaciale]KAI5215608.1 dynamin GTPase [Aureobasidium subglaciale]KAI5218840.1 dynamin GTPase [Aureobasidium subglaciale]KAI5256486.1 dynamin GTPase [Aureobasidium subglaciale]